MTVVLGHLAAIHKENICCHLHSPDVVQTPSLTAEKEQAVKLRVAIQVHHREEVDETDEKTSPFEDYN
ncbi:hypothetical protein RUM43_000567 [Polyplax serrata]|uniref:Uncharacterized protein n=1 Tax=Polyplax serrata TaxID=468196 RepID=A0AAN8SHB3_POLSC